MTKQQIINYKVIEDSELNKGYFNKTIKENKSFVLLGDFKNEHGELFVLYTFDYPIVRENIYATGDELEWEMGYQFLDGALVKGFNLSRQERTKMEEIIDKRK